MASGRARIRNRVSILDEIQMDDLLTGIKGHDKIVWYQCRTMAFAGLRTDEVKRLRPVDIRMDEGKIRIPDIKSATNQAKSDWVKMCPPCS